MTKTIWLEFLTADSRAAAIEVIKRMGWDIDAEHLTEDGGHSQTRTKICLNFWICAGPKRGNAPLFFVKMHNALFDGPLTHAAGRIFIIHHRQQKVNRQTAQKIMLRISRNCATFQQKVLDFRRLRWYTVYRS